MPFRKLVLPGKDSVESQAVAKVVPTATNPRSISMPVDLLEEVLIQPSLPIPWLFGAFWSTFERTHRPFVLVSFTAAALAATPKPDAAVA